MTVDFERITKALKDEETKKFKDGEENPFIQLLALLRSDMIDVSVKALKLYHEQIQPPQ